MNLTIAVVALLIVVGAVVYVTRRRKSQELRESETVDYVEHVSDVLACSRSFALAARESADKVRALVGETICERFPLIDCVAIFVRQGQHLVCVYASKGRCERYADRAEYSIESDAAKLPVAAYTSSATVAGGGESVIHPGCKYAVAVPLVFDKGNTSVVYLSSSRDSFEAVMPAVELLLEQAEPALLLATSREDSESRATYDSLTGLLGRGAFDARLRADIARAQETGKSLALLYIDADHFKSWNDTYGHHSGDLLLQRLAEIFTLYRGTARDLIARRGGDEFCIILQDVDKRSAIERALNLGSAIAFDDRSALVPPELASGDLIRITASIGVALFPRDAGSLDELLFRADKIMYQSKERGRARVCYVDDGGEIRDVDTSETDRRTDDRPFSDRRVAERPFVPAREGTG